MKVAATGLYHIVLDLNKAGDLANAQIIVAPVEWGVRGAMNGWGFTKMEATEFSNEGITYTIKDAEMSKNGEFKFAYGGAWKITLDDAGKVRANTNLGNVQEGVAEGYSTAAVVFVEHNGVRYPAGCYHSGKRLLHLIVSLYVVKSHIVLYAQ